MELHTLQQLWNTDFAQDANDYGTDYRSMIQGKSRGPVTILKDKFKKQLMAFPLALVMGGYIVHRHPQMASDASFWFFAILIVAMTVYYSFNYSLISRLTGVESSLRSHVEKQVSLLERGYGLYQKVMIAAIGLFVLLLEWLMLEGRATGIEGWQGISPVVRVVVYAIVITVAYFAGRRSYQKQYGQHLDFLKNILSKLEQ